MKNIVKFILIAFIGSFIIACDMDDEDIMTELSLRFDIEDKSVVPETVKAIFKNTETGETKEFNNLPFAEVNKLSIPFGLYDIQVSSEMLKKDKKYTFSANTSKYAVKECEQEFTVNLLKAENFNYFILKEAFYSGSVFKEGHAKAGKNYIYCSYVILTNNTNDTLYADSLCFALSIGNSNDKRVNFGSSKFLPERVGCEAIFMIPGNGKEHPVEPGKDIVLCMEAQDHSINGVNCPDLSKKADFEWFEKIEDPRRQRFQLKDNPDVKNMSILLKESWTFTLIHQRGAKALFIFKLDEDFKTFADKHTFEYAPINPKMPKRKGLFLPSKMIADGVQFSEKEHRDDDILPANIDKSHTYVSEGKKAYAVQRKVLREENGRKIYQDTNDSANDFNRDLPSSLL